VWSGEGWSAMAVPQGDERIIARVGLDFGISYRWLVVAVARESRLSNLLQFFTPRNQPLPRLWLRCSNARAVPTWSKKCCRKCLTVSIQLVGSSPKRVSIGGILSGIAPRLSARTALPVQSTNLDLWHNLLDNNAISAFRTRGAKQEELHLQ
jgi:hypothetical protein